jgi:hypothetical protein
MHGILAAVVLSLIAHARHSYRLRTRVLTRSQHPRPNSLKAALAACARLQQSAHGAQVEPHPPAIK